MIGRTYRLPVRIVIISPILRLGLRCRFHMVGMGNMSMTISLRMFGRAGHSVNATLLQDMGVSQFL